MKVLPLENEVSELWGCTSLCSIYSWCLNQTVHFLLFDIKYSTNKKMQRNKNSFVLPFNWLLLSCYRLRHLSESRSWLLLLLSVTCCLSCVSMYVVLNTVCWLSWRSVKLLHLYFSFTEVKKKWNSKHLFKLEVAIWYNFSFSHAFLSFFSKSPEEHS